MKTKLTFAASLLLLTGIVAQGQTKTYAGVTVMDKQDTVTISTGTRNLLIIEKDGANGEGSRTEVVYFKDGNCRKKSYKNRMIHSDLMVDLGFNIYDERNIFNGNKGDEFISQNTSKSVGIAVYPWIGSIGLDRNRRVEIQSGLGFDWANYRFNNGMTIANFDNYTFPVPAYDAGTGQSFRDVDKSKLMTLYINVPLMCRFNVPVNGRNSIYLATGVIGGVKIGSHTKVKYENGDKDKDRDSFNLNMFRYQLTFRAGYRGVGLFFNYQMSQMFENNKGPKLYPYAVGLTFTM